MQIQITDETINNAIELLESKRFKIQQKIQIHQKNQSLNIFTYIPKAMLLEKICSFLEEKELIIFGSSCKYLRMLIYSPIGFKFLMKFEKNTNNLYHFENKHQDQII